MCANEKIEWIEVEVLRRTGEAEDIIGLELQAVDGRELPPFSAGAHIDVRTSAGLVRQYSLCNDPHTGGNYRLGVLLDPNSRGGSRAVHEELRSGSRVAIGIPRNLFPLVDESRSITLIAGGIGITPLLAMAYTLHRHGRAFSFHVCARTAERVAFRDVLQGWGERVHYHYNTVEDPLAPAFDPTRDIGPYVDGHYIYTCGPSGFLEFIRKSAAELGWPEDAVRLEHFGAEAPVAGEAITVEARRSGITVEVGPESTIAEALQAAGVPVEMSCEQGICGMCMTKVLDGVPEHRDLYLTEAEKVRNDRMTICCSRAKSACLVLDI
ncbi:Phenoxybenzoate dioxygenase subunit beta [compost metagenome]